MCSSVKYGWCSSFHVEHTGPALFCHFPCEHMVFKMLSMCGKHIKDPSVVRKLTFAASFYLPSLPNYWQTVHKFCIATKDRSDLRVQDVQVLVENMTFLDKQAFNSNQLLMSEILQVSRQGSDVPLGIVLISPKETCHQCGSRLYLRSDRPSTVTIYDDNLGTLPGTHYTKYCRRRNCSVQEHYGYCTHGDCGAMIYNSEWSSLPYFLSSREAAIAMEILRRLDRDTNWSYKL